MTSKDRILIFLQKTGIKKTEFFKLTGISPSNFKGQAMQSELGSDKIANILTIYSQLSPDWLLLGTGDMFRSNNPLSLSKEENLPVAHPSDSPTEGIPLIPISAMAGSFTGEQTVLEYECERFVVPTFKGAEFLISVKGSSMYPRYNSGDIVACKRLPMDDLFFQWNKVYVLDTDQGPLIKRVKPGSDKEHVLIISDNEHYEPFELPINRIYHVALVIGVIRLE